MPRLRASNIEEITLPSSTTDDPAIVKIDTYVTTAAAMKVGDAKDRGSAIIELIADAIREWNFVDADGNPEPITAEAVSHLHIGDFTVLSDRFMDAVEKVVGSAKLSIDEKKASS